MWKIKMKLLTQIWRERERERELLLTVDHPPDPDGVRVAVVEQAHGGHAVSPRSPRLLIVAFHGLGQRLMNHKPHIRLVYAHPKGYCGTHNLK